MASRTKGMTQQRDVDDDYSKGEDLVGDQELESLYAWVDSIPLSRPKRNIARDFSDGILIAELLNYFYHDQGLVDLHNYSPASGTNTKKGNWYVLNRKVFTKMNFQLSEEVICDIVTCKPGMIEKVLVMLRAKIENINYVKRRQSDKPEVDQHQASPGRKDGHSFKVGMDDHRSRLPGKGGKHRRHSCQEEQDKKSPAKQAGRQVGVPKKRIGPLVEPDMVPRYVVEEKEQEVLSRDETISILQAKVSRLEHLLHLKDMRIDDLQSRIESTRPTGIRK